MKNSINHEVLLFTTTTFAKRQLCELNEQGSRGKLGPSRQLEIACWNGLLGELLPEIMQIPSCTEKLFLWDIEIEGSYLKINRGANQPVPEDELSLDPHVFFYMLHMN